MSEKNKQLAKAKNKNITDKVLNKINIFRESGELRIPKGYSPENALKGAWLTLQEVQDRNKKPALQVCTEISIANALLEMVTMGLSPIKKQAYFIVHGNKLTLMPSYMGNIALAKRYGGLKWIRANVIYKTDDFSFEIKEDGRKSVKSHEQNLDALGSDEIVGVYAVYETDDGVDVEIMNISQIKQSWMQGSGYGKSKTHKNFGDQMAKKTVINRACKLLINASDDTSVLGDQDDVDYSRKVSDDEIEENSNIEEIDFEEEVVEVEDQEYVSEKPKNKTEMLF